MKKKKVIKNKNKKQKNKKKIKKQKKTSFYILKIIRKNNVFKLP